MMRNTPLYELTLCVGVIEAAARFAHAHDRPTAAILFGAAAEHARGVIRQTTEFRHQRPLTDRGQTCKVSSLFPPP